jgi:hypothetical protein
VNATVANDVAPGGVTWSVSCANNNAGACGYVTPYQTASGKNATYTAPPVAPTGPVTIIATSISAPGQNASAMLTITQSTTLSVNFAPPAPSQLSEGSTVNLTAAVANDSSNEGVDWQVCGGCGFFTTTPAIPAIPATAKTPYVPPVPAVTATSVKAWPNGLPISYTAPATPPAGGNAVISATAHKDGTTAASASIAITPSGTGPSLTGTVQAGIEPVIGSQVALYAAGSSGYGSASTLLSAAGQNPYATTDDNGKFILPAGYGCPGPTSEVYLVAVGGHAGTNPTNGNLVLMTALGPCNALSSSPVVVNEVTTVASAWAIAPFAANPLTTGLVSYLNIGTSSGNAVGLSNAFATVNNLVNISTGQALYTVPAGNATVPYPEINTFADMLDACAVTGGGSSGDGSVCGTLFVDANPYVKQTQTVYTGVPTDTLQAAMEIVQNPGVEGQVVAINLNQPGTNNLYSLVSPASPFQPILTGAPNDLSLSLNFTSGGGLSGTSGASSLAIDDSGDVWITNTQANSVTEWDSLGAAISTSGYTVASLTAPGPIAIDTSGNAWICDQNGLTELSFLGAELTGSPFGGAGLTTSGCLGLAIDGLGNLWATNSMSVAKFDNLGDPLSPATGYTIPISPTDTTTATILPPLAIDDSNNVWVGVSETTGTTTNLALAELINASGQVNDLSPNPISGPSGNFVDLEVPPDQTQLALDGSGNVWIPGSSTSSADPVGTLFKVPAYGGTGTTDTFAAELVQSAIQFPIVGPRGVAIDGAGVIWVGNEGGSDANTGLDTPPNLTGFNPALPLDSFEYASSSLSNRPLSVSVDGSGNVWALLNNGTVTEYVGIATPAVTPLSLAVKNKKLGAKP